jgi:glutamate--cysteine ligase
MSSDLGGAAGEEIPGREGLVRWFHEAAAARAGKPPLVGVESELLPVDPASGAAVAYSGRRGVEAALACLVSKGFEDPPPLAPRTTRLVRGELSVNLEPGAQVEVSGTAVASLVDAARELDATLAVIGRCAREQGFRLAGHGVQPVSAASEIELVPKRRYDAMTRYFAARGGARFLDMMRRTASVQASYDYLDEADAGRKLRLSLLGAPVAAAVFANSPVALGRETGLLSERTLIWLDVDRDRQGTIDAALDGAWSFERYVDFALRVPAILVRAQDGGVAEAGGRPFADLLARGAPGGRRLTFADWEIHLTTIFTEARLKRVVECRSCDAPRPAEGASVPALWTGLLYHAPSLEAGLALLGPHRAALGSVELRREVAREGLRARLPGEEATVLDLARPLARLAEAGLRARGLGEERLLAPVLERLETGRTPADRSLEAFRRGGVAALVEDCAA